MNRANFNINTHMKKLANKVKKCSSEVDNYLI